MTAIDLQFFDGLHQQGQSVFVHGSIMAGRITPTSDVDFTVIGKTDDLAPDLRDTLMPGLNAASKSKELTTCLPRYGARMTVKSVCT